MVDKLEEHVTALLGAVAYAQEVLDERLPLSTPAPIKDSVFDHVMRVYMHDRAPKAEHKPQQCERCLQVAWQWALYALGWDDRKTPRPLTAPERMAMLKEQMDLGLEILKGYGPHGD